ncbi:hypothetical protein ABPG72_015502 [Tetrahymena utriculariae]
MNQTPLKEDNRETIPLNNILSSSQQSQQNLQIDQLQKDRSVARNAQEDIQFQEGINSKNNQDVSNEIDKNTQNFLQAHEKQDQQQSPHQHLEQGKEKKESISKKPIKNNYQSILNSQIFRWIIIASTLSEIAAYLMHDYSYRITKQSKKSIQINVVADFFELITNIIFTIEIILIVLAYGAHRSTLKQIFTTLNALLLTVLISSWISYATNEIEVFNVYKHFRILTIFRLFPVLKKKVYAFFGSFKHLGKTFFPLICVIIFYSVIGISFFRGLIESRCRLTEHPEEGQTIWEIDESVHLPCGVVSCPTHSYCGNPAEYGLPENHHEFDNENMLWGYVNFNDIFNALFSVYNFLMINGWVATTNIFWRAQDKTVSGIYFVSLVLLLSQIFSNIVLATLYEGFMDINTSGKQSIKEGGESQLHNDKQSRASPTQKKSIFKKKQKNASKFTKQSNDSQYEQEMMEKKGLMLISQISYVRDDQLKYNTGYKLTLFLQSLFKYAKQFRKSSVFSFLHFANIIAIIVVLCIDNISIEGYDYIQLNKADFIITMIFFTFSFFELITLGKKYFQQKLLILDALIILLISISYIVEGCKGYDIFNPKIQTFIFIRWIKMLRILRLINEFSIFGSLKILLHTYYYTLASLPEFLFLWVLLIVLFVQIGRELLAGKDGGDEHFDEEETIIRINYNTLHNSLIAVIMICYNEEWQLVMYKYRRIVGYKSILYHFLAMLILQVLFVRLFIGIFINIFMKWLRENEIVLYHSQTLVIIKKLTKQATNFFSSKKKKIQPQQSKTLQENNNIKEQAFIKNSTEEIKEYQKVEIKGSEKLQGLKNEIKILDQDTQHQQINGSVKNSQMIKNKNKNLNLPKIFHTASIDEIQTKKQNLKRKQSLEMLRESTQPSINVIMSRSKSNENLVVQKQISSSRETSGSHQNQLTTYRKINTHSHASTAFNIVLNNDTSEKDQLFEPINQENKNMSSNNDQKQNNIFLLSPQRSIFNRSKSGENGNNQDELSNMQHAKFNFQNHNSSQKRTHHSQLPSISLQSPLNSSRVFPFVNQKGNNEIIKQSSREYLQSDVNSYPSQFKYDKLLIMSIESLKSQENNEKLSKNGKQNSEHNSNKQEQQNQFIEKLNNVTNNTENKSLRSSSFKEVTSDQNENSNDITNEEVEKSLFIFSRENKFRKICNKIVKHDYFDYFNSLCISTLAFLFCVDTPFVDPNTSEQTVILIFHAILTIFFIIENIMQIIAYGFIFSPSSFIQRNWFFNSIDIITTFASFFYTVDFWPRSIYVFKFILILRLTVLFSFLSRQVKEVHHAGIILIKCLPRMLRLIIFAILFLLISGALTTKLLKGSMHNCFLENEGDGENIGLPEIVTKYDCLDLGGDWIDSQYNFNNIINSLQILFMVQSSEGWIHIMFSVYDSTSPDINSHYRQNSLWAIFFIQFFFIANICILNMFVGLVVETQLEMIESEHKTKDLHKFQKEWLFIKKSIYQLKPSAKLKIPQDKIRKFLFENLIQGNALKIVFYTFTLANCINLMLFKNRQSQEEIDKLYKVNEVCLVAMIVEIFCRIICLNFIYFKEIWNIIDLFIVIIGWINLRLQQTNEFEIFDRGLRIFDGIAKGLQLLRFYRIMKHFTIIKKLFKSLQYAISSIFGIFQVLIIFLFISVLISMNLFPYIKEQKIINGYDVTFRDFPNALFTLIRVMTSEYWYVVAQEGAKKMQPDFVCFENIILYDDYQKYGQNACGTRHSYIFFYGFYLVFTLVILNIFIATIIESYKEAFSADESAVNHYQLDDVLELWKQYDPEGKGYISYKEFWQFSSQIAIIYGVKSEDLMDIQNKNEFLKTLNIPIFEDPINKVFCYKFHDVVISISKISVQIKYGITTLEPENSNLRNQLDSLIKKKKLSGDNMIKPTSFTSADMVLIIVLTRKVKQWRQKVLNKQDECILDIRQLTQKLKSQFNKSQNINLEQSSKEEENDKKEINQEIQQLNQQQTTEQPQIKDILKEDKQQDTEQFMPITAKSKLPPIEKRKFNSKQSTLNKVEKNVKFIEDLLTKPQDTEDGLVIQNNNQDDFNYDNKEQIKTISDDFFEKNKDLPAQICKQESNIPEKTQIQQKNIQEQIQNQNTQNPIYKNNQQEKQVKQIRDEKLKFSIPPIEFNANSVIQEYDNFEVDDFGLDINFNQNFILAFDEQEETQNI